jgi:transposase
MAMLEDKLFFWMKLHKATHFLQDGGPCHTSKKVMKFLKENKIPVLDGLENAQDLNPIENLWSIMKKKLQNDHSITSLPLFIAAIKRMWISGLPIRLMRKLSHSHDQEAGAVRK